MTIYSSTNIPWQFNLLLYGKAGAGKTSLAATAGDHEAMRQVLFLNVEGGMLSLTHRDDILIADTPTAAAVEEIFWKLAQAEEEPYSQIKTVVIDSGTELQNVMLAQTAEEKARTDARRGPNDIYLEDYGVNTAALRRLGRMFRDLRVNVIMTALPKEIYPPNIEDTTGVDPIEVVPLFTSKLGTSLAGFADFVWYVYVKDGRRMVLTTERRGYMAKTRGHAFAQQIGPTFRVAGTNTETGEVEEGHTLATLYDLLLSCRQ